MEQEILEKKKMEPAGFWIRFVAVVIDGIIVSILCIPINMFFPFPSHYQTNLYDSTTYMNMGLNYVLSLVLVFIWYGWFYKNKGGAPGKLAMGLQVINTKNNQNCNYWQAFFRETVGKIVSGVILFIGFIMVVFRKDKKALHDLLFNTQVLKK